MLTDQEIVHYSRFPVNSPERLMIFDIECFPNYFLIAFRHVHTQKHLIFELPIQTDKLLWVCQNFLLVGYNIRKYDIPITQYALFGKSHWELKELSNLLIGGLKYWKLKDEFSIETPKNWDFIDLIELLPVDKDSETRHKTLKECAARLNARKIQDLPYDPDKHLTKEEMGIVRDYCINDLDVTELLLKDRIPNIQLRCEVGKQYGCDLRSKSDAQMAEEIFKRLVFKETGQWPKAPNIAPGTAYQYQDPGLFQFQTPEMIKVFNDILDHSFVLLENGQLDKRPFKLNFRGLHLSLGIGGLHSQEDKRALNAEIDSQILDADAASYYPNLMLLQNINPSGIGPIFSTLYKKILDERIVAKKNKNKILDETFKIVLNGTFGKLGDIYSIFRAPDMLLQVTLTGQLGLLQLIEWFYLCGIETVSANTDGITAIVHRSKRHLYDACIAQWQKVMKMKMEVVEYSKLYSWNVNNYIAIKTTGEIKRKGAFEERSLARSINNPVVNDALLAYISTGVPFEETIMACKDPFAFCSIRKVQGGAVQDGKYIGKVVRFYHAKNWEHSITYKKSGNKVPDSDRCKLYLEAREFPQDIDYSWYIKKCQDMLFNLGIKKKITGLF